MTDPLRPTDLAALLAVAADDPDALVRVAALDAASRFRLDPAAWNVVARASMQIVNAEPAGSKARREALVLAVRIPLRTLREHLRHMAEDPKEADRDAIADALDAAGDPSRILPLIEEARQAGGLGRFRSMAAMPVEDVITARDVPPLPQDAAPDFWRALVLARLGDYGLLDAFFSGEVPDAELYGNPWTEYDEIARVRPVPEPMRAHLLEALARLDSSEPSLRQRQVPERLIRLTAWAATGVADAQGAPLEHEVAPSPVTVPAPPSPPSSEQLGQAMIVRAKLPSALFDERRLTTPEFAALTYLPKAEVAGLIRAVVAEGNYQARAGAESWPTNEWLGSKIIEFVGCCPVTDDWPAAELVVEQLRSQRPALDDGQLAWIIARDHTVRLINKLAGLLTPDRNSEERLRVLHLLSAAGDCQGGRAGSPMRGAGPGAAALTGKGELIDDRPSHAAKHLAEPAPRPDIEKRRVNARILCGDRQRNAFVAGADNVIRCWIGLPEPSSASANEPIPILPVHIPPDGLRLEVQLAWRDSSGEQHTDSKLMLLPAERTARSGDCDLRIHVPPDERYVSADIMFRYSGRMFEIVRLGAPVLEANEAEGPQHEIKITVQASGRQVIEIGDSQHVDDVFVFGDDGSAWSSDADASASSGLLQFGAESGTKLELGDAKLAIKWINDQLSLAETRVVRRHATPPPSGGGGATQADSSVAEELDANDEDVRCLLRDMARHGAGLYQRLVEQKAFRDPGDRIQVVNRDPDTYVPLEFVYDGGYPVKEATLCAAGLDALKHGADTCPKCRLPAPIEKRSDAPVVCLFGFWSLRKVIERVATGQPGQTSVPRPARRSLPVIDAVAFASSHLVPDDERQATREALQNSFGSFYPADDWIQWKEAVGHQPPLLVVIPHHGIQAGSDYLEIGAQELSENLGKLDRGQINQLYVNPDGREPGPIVLLLGCETAGQNETGYVEMTRRIQQQHASIVLGTLAQILGRQAAPVARALVAELVAVDDKSADFGTVMRRVRQRMLARGYLMALCLVALGDAEWRLTPRPVASNL